jgi:hypothetical protein
MITTFLSGCIVCGFLVVAGFFFKFWRTTRDTFFLLFSIAFLLFGIEQTCIGLFIGPETLSFIYIFRLIATGFIIAAIIDKNRK